MSTTNTARQWSADEFADELCRRSYWCEQTADVVIPMAALIKLAFDARTPDDKAIILQQKVARWTQTNNPLSS